MTNVAILGTGAMGSRVAKQLIKAGHRVTVYNRTSERSRVLTEVGAAVAETPRDAARDAELVISTVTDDQASRAVWTDPKNGALSGLSPEAVAVESSTVSPGWIAELAPLVERKGAGFLDAPMVGSRPQADSGNLVYLIGGEEATYAKVRTVLAGAASSIYHVGPTGSGAVMKLVVNSLFACQVAALAEALALATRSGLAEQSVVAILNSLPTTSPALQGVGAQMVSRSFAPLFPIALVEKDLRYAVALARQLDTRVALAEAARGVYENACKGGLSDANISGVYRLFERG